MENKRKELVRENESASIADNEELACSMMGTSRHRAITSTWRRLRAGLCRRAGVGPVRSTRRPRSTDGDASPRLRLRLFFLPPSVPPLPRLSNIARLTLRAQVRVDAGIARVPRCVVRSRELTLFDAGCLRRVRSRATPFSTQSGPGRG